MKKSLVVVVVLVLVAGLSTSAFAERWGKPGANLEKGQSSLGLEYNYIEAEWDLQPPAYTSCYKAEEQAALNQLLVRVGYGLTEDLEAFIKIGGTSTDLTDIFHGSEGCRNDHLQSNMEFTIVGGLAWTILEKDNFRLGAVGQLTYFEFDDTHLGAVGLRDQELVMTEMDGAIDANVFTLEGALLASYDLDKLTPYAGVCMVITDVDMRWRILGNDPALLDIDVEQEGWFGMVVGVNYEVVENVNVGVELTHVSEGVGVSVGVNCAL